MQSKDLAFLSTIKWNTHGLVPSIVQDAESGEVLMLAWMNEHAIRQTLASGQAHFYSRSRRAMWHKGETSGHVQHVVEMSVDCDADVLLIKVRQIGGACHEGYRSCFFRQVDEQGGLKVVAERVFDPAKAYRAAEKPRTNPTA
jgi:phosphoribosyl-AMP cyclohydrolase